MILSAKARSARVAAVLATACAGMLLTGFEAPQTDSLRAAVYAPPSAPTAPPVLLPRAVIEAASVYKAYVERASATSPAFTDGASVAATLKASEAYQSQQMQRGEAAYAAIVALQDPTFVATVRAFGADPGQRAQVAASLMADPNYAVVFHGSDSAAGLIIAALKASGQRLAETGEKVRLAAYEVQHQKWSKDMVPDREGRLALAKSLSESPLSGGADDMDTLQKASAGEAPMSLAGEPAPPPYSPTVVRALAAAAMAALGDGGEQYSDQLLSLLTEPEEGECLHMAKLNLYECLAVSKPHYEDVFCLGQHVLKDTGMCIVKGVTPRGEVTPTLVAVSSTAQPYKVAKKAVKSTKKKAKAKSKA